MHFGNWQYWHDAEIFQKQKVLVVLIRPPFVNTLQMMCGSLDKI